MTNDEIREMFKVNADLEHMSVLDPKRDELEKRFNILSKQYIDEYLSDTPNEQPKENAQAMSIEQAFGIMFDTCKKATEYELAFKPNSLTENDIQMMANARNAALQTLVLTLNNG